VTFEEDVMKFCRHLAKQHGEQMGTAKVTIELAAELGAPQAASLERLANSVLMLAPDYQENMKQHVARVGGKTGAD
jgi:enoyl-CoA hydratase